MPLQANPQTIADRAQFILSQVPSMRQPESVRRGRLYGTGYIVLPQSGDVEGVADEACSLSRGDRSVPFGRRVEG